MHILEGRVKMAQIKIGFIGYESTDIIIYIARLLSYAGKEVYVVDQTKKQLLLRAIPLPEELANTAGYYKNILVVNGESCDVKETDGPDIVLYNFGYRLKDEKIKECDMVVYVTDMMTCNAQLLKDVEISDTAEAYLIVRNAIPLKYDERYLANTIGRKFEKDNIFIIQYEESDYKSRCYLYMDKNHKLTSLSGSMRVAVFEIFKSVTKEQYGRKEQAVLFKRA